MIDDDDERLERIERLFAQIHREMEDMRTFIHDSRMILERLSNDLDRKLRALAGRTYQ